MDKREANWFQPKQPQTDYGDMVLLAAPDQKRYLIKLTPRQTLHTHLGSFPHDELVGKTLGTLISSQMGNEALMLEPSLSDLIRHIRRGTQIIYPKDAAHLVQRLNLRAGNRVVEAGTGSGALTIALAWSVAPTGRVYTYEAQDDTHRLAQRNLERVGLLPYVEMFARAIDGGFAQTDVDALFLDVREPWRYLPHVRTALRSGGFFASLVPTTNQVSDLLRGLEEHGFGEIAVEELLLRTYKAVPERLRPEDEMIAHTGFLVSARMLTSALDPTLWQPKERRRFLARQKGMQELEKRRRRRAEEGDDGPRYPQMPLPG